MKIKEALAQQQATLKNVEITELEDTREFTKRGRTLRVQNGKVKDDSGEMGLALWNEEVDQFEEGDKVDITDGWVKEWQGDLQISSGRSGEIAKAGDSGSPGNGDGSDSPQPKKGSGKSGSSE